MQIKLNPAQLCSGLGKYHSTDHRTTPKPYITITLADIEAMAEAPQGVAKKDAQWVIPSTLLSRKHTEQRTGGEFHALWADIDDSQGMPFSNIVSRVSVVVPHYLAYTSRSATQDNQKARIIIPLAEPANGEHFVILQKILNDKLEAEGITPDRVTERVGQLCYLPNRGEFYQYHIENLRGAFHSNKWSELIAVEREAIKAAHKANTKRLEVSRVKATARMASGCKSPIDAYNQEYNLANLFCLYGYADCRGRWESPSSESGNAGVVTKGDRWISSHGSDVAKRIGRTNADGTGCSGDAFDLFKYYEHGNDQNAALKAAGEMFTVEGVTLTKTNQVEYMQAQERLTAVHPVGEVSTDAAQEQLDDTWKAPTKVRPKLPAAALYGLAGDFVRLATADSEADPAAVLFQFLARFGCEVGNQCHVAVGDGMLYCRLFVQVVGNSSKARKGTSAKPVEKVFKLSSENYLMPARTSPGPMSSGEGLIWAVRDEVQEFDKKKQVFIVTDPGVADKRLIVVDEEIAALYQASKRDGNTVSAVIRKMFDGGTNEPLTKTSKIKSTDPHVVLVGHIVADELKKLITKSDLYNGFANRFLFVHAEREKEVSRPKPMPTAQLRPIQQRLASAIKAAGKIVGDLPLTPEAEQLWDAEYPALTQDHPGALGVVVNRAEALVLILALHYALLDSCREIDVPHLKAALAAWEYCFQSAANIFGELQADPKEQKILDALAKNNEMTLTEISRDVFNGNEPKKSLHPLLTEMIGRKVIGQKTARPGGSRKSSTVFFLQPYEFNELYELYTGQPKQNPNNSYNSYNSYGTEKKQESFPIEQQPVIKLAANDFFNMELF